MLVAWAMQEAHVVAVNVRISHTFVIVDDQDEALRFYRDVLGLRLRTDAPIGDMRWLTVGPASRPELETGLMPPEMGHSPDDARALSELLAIRFAQPLAATASG